MADQGPKKSVEENIAWLEAVATLVALIKVFAREFLCIDFPKIKCNVRNGLRL